VKGVAVIAASLALAYAPQALAFDTAPHFDITGDALTAEGFGRDAVRLAQVNNWFVDLYVNAKATPQSGHAPWWKMLLGARWYLGEVENWNTLTVASATKMHFDSHKGGWGYRQKQDLEHEWNRLLEMTVRMCREGLRTGKPALCLTAMGAGFHQLQDFYAHSNWVEPRFGSLPGYDGPGWEDQGRGTAPTWFDLPVAIRDPARSRAYTNGNGKPIDYKDRLWNREHGNWRSGSNKQLGTSMNKDWPGRPRYLEAYMASYFATRQWVEAVRRAVDNTPFWNQVKSWQPQTAKQRGDLRFDLRKGARAISYWAGHWQGQGEPTFGEAPGPGGSLDDIFFATRDYFARNRTSFRSEFERVVKLLGVESDNPPTYAVPSTRQMQQLTRFVVVKVLRMKSRGAGDIGPDDADFYAQG
jgi:hypothetical protein